MTRRRADAISTAVAVIIATIVVAVLFKGTAKGAESHFSKKEFACSCCGVAKIAPGLVEKLEDLREAIGNKPIIITSGYRCPKHNREIGGAKYSRHMTGEAVDIKVKGMTPAEVAIQAKKVGFTFIKTYRSWTHVDIRRKG